MPSPKVSRAWNLEECTSHLPGTHQRWRLPSPVRAQEGEAEREARLEGHHLFIIPDPEVISCPAPGPTGEDGPARPGS